MTTAKYKIMWLFNEFSGDERWDDLEYDLEEARDEVRWLNSQHDVCFFWYAPLDAPASAATEACRG